MQDSSLPWISFVFQHYVTFVCKSPKWVHIYTTARARTAGRSRPKCATCQLWARSGLNATARADWPICANSGSPRLYLDHYPCLASNLRAGLCLTVLSLWRHLFFPGSDGNWSTSPTCSTFSPKALNNQSEWPGYYFSYSPDYMLDERAAVTNLACSPPT